MKKLVLALAICLFFSTAYAQLEGTGEDIIPRLKAEDLMSMENLSWQDLKGYKFEDVGSDMVVRRYTLDSGEFLTLGGPSLKSNPTFIYLLDSDYEIKEIIKN